MYLGQLLESLGLAFFIFVNHHFVIAVAGIIIFTIGEILGSISKNALSYKKNTGNTSWKSIKYYDQLRRINWSIK